MRHARTTDEGGRGLFLVARMTSRRGTRYATGEGRTTWAEQEIPVASPGLGEPRGPLCRAACRVPPVWGRQEVAADSSGARVWWPLPAGLWAWKAVR
jgi:hypothetical protein